MLLIPADDPKQSPQIVKPRTDDVEYAVDHWGDRFVILTNLDAEDFRVMTAPLERPDEWTELVPHEPGRRVVAIDPFAGHLVLHEWHQAQQRLRVLFARGRRARLRSRRGAARGRDRRESGMGRNDLPLPLSVADDTD